MSQIKQQLWDLDLTSCGQLDSFTGLSPSSFKTVCHIFNSSFITDVRVHQSLVHGAEFSFF